MYGVRLIHWNKAEARQKAKIFERAGYQVNCETIHGPDDIRRLRRNPPDVLVIDLSRLPSQGRDLALTFRQFKTTRNVPIVFVEGDPQKLVQIKKLLPDAFYSKWEMITDTVKTAISSPPKNPLVPDSVFVGYSGKPLWKKLGIKSDHKVSMVNAPVDFRKTLGELPQGVVLNKKVNNHSNLIILFIQSQAELNKAVKKMAGVISDKAGLWIAWPKKSSGVTTDITQTEVRSIGLAAGLVDYKICAIDTTWSGLLFTRRKRK